VANFRVSAASLPEPVAPETLVAEDAAIQLVGAEACDAAPAEPVLNVTLRPRQGLTLWMKRRPAYRS